MTKSSHRGPSGPRRSRLSAGRKRRLSTRWVREHNTHYVQPRAFLLCNEYFAMRKLAPSGRGSGFRRVSLEWDAAFWVSTVQKAKPSVR